MIHRENYTDYFYHVKRFYQNIVRYWNRHCKTAFEITVIANTFFNSDRVF